MPLHLTRIAHVEALPDPAGLPEGFPVLYGGAQYAVKDGAFVAVGGGVINIVAASGTALDLDVSLGSVQDITLTGNCTFTFLNDAPGSELLLVLRQDATGSRTVTWPGSVLWAGAASPTLTTASSSIDVIRLMRVGSDWIGTVVGLDYA